MRISLCFAVLLSILLLESSLTSARHIHRHGSHHNHQPGTRSRTQDGMMTKPDFFGERKPIKPRRADTLQIAGSSLPDCSHACGSCTPCRLVMVSFVCSTLEEAETCPMAYKCMCNRKSYPVP